MPSRRDPVTGLVVRGSSNSNERGSAEERRRRKAYLLVAYAADVKARVQIIESGDVLVIPTGTNGTYSDTVQVIDEVDAVRCYRCGCLLVAIMRPDGQPGSGSMTIDRIIPGCKGGTYRRSNIRPACGRHNSETGGAMANGKVHAEAKKRAAKRRVKK
jgi:hypothetical protein